MNEVIIPTVKGMKKEGHPYTGFLYAGIMIDPNGTPLVLEYNCRFGDPETQPIMMRLQSSLVGLCDAALDKKLDHTQASWDKRAAVGIVLAAGGYPGSYKKGDVISGLPNPENKSAEVSAKVFHAGTRLDANGDICTQGGRVLCATALGNSVTEAQANAYALADTIQWSNVYCRRDIGHRAIARENAKE
jgi:phosphoribosylamine--glycine ligase